MTRLIPSELWILLAGAIGAIVPTALANDLTRKQGLIFIGVGVVTATFIAPAINEHLFPTSGTNFQGGVAFVTGLVGLKLTQIIRKLIERRGEALLETMINGVSGGQTQSKQKGE